MSWILPAIIAGQAGGQTLSSIFGNRAQQNANQQASDNILKGQQQATGALTAGYDQAQDQLAPFRALTVPSLQNLMNFTYMGKNKANMPNIDFSNLPKSNLSESLMKNFGGGAGSGNALDMLTPEELKVLGLDKTDTAIFGTGSEVSRPSAAGRAGKGAAAGFAIGGPLGAGVGAAVGALWPNNHNPDKAEATAGVNRLSDYTWNKLAPAVVSGKISPDEAVSIFNGWWQDWINAMQNAKVDPGILNSSVQSQSEYFKTFGDFINAAKGGSKDFSAWPYIGQWS